MIRRSVLLTLVAGGAFLTACGPTTPVATGAGGGTATSSAPVAWSTVDPCRLVTEPEATTAIGAPAGPGVPGGTTDSPQCLYGNGALIINVSNDGHDGYATQHDAMTSGPAGSWSEVTGVGDGAFEANGGPTAMVFFYRGSALVQIILQGKLAAPADAAITLARSAVARL